MLGYQDDFLDPGNDQLRVAPPTFLPLLQGEVLQSENLDAGVFLHYPNYTLVMNKVLRSCVYAAANMDQVKRVSGLKGRSWRFDTRVGHQFQLDNEYYRDRDGEPNLYDRGHVAPRAGIAWGENKIEAKHASDETYYWTNATLQHRFFNGDEWEALESWVRNFKDGANERLTVFTGPIYSDVNLFIRPQGEPPAPVPSAFFKVLVFRHRDCPDVLSVRAFIIPQSPEVIADDEGWRPSMLQRYQVSVRQIEELTGLKFPPEIPAANPMFFEAGAEAAKVGVDAFPEMHEVNTDTDIIDPGQPRVGEQRPVSGLFIMAALVNPAGKESQEEWVSVVNLGPTTASLNGLVLRDKADRKKALTGALDPGETLKVHPLKPVRLVNDDGLIQLTTKDGRILDVVAYGRTEAKREGHIISFMTKRVR